MQTQVASTHTETPFQVSVSTQITSAVATVRVAEGALVNPGEILVSLVDKEARAALVLAQRQLAEAEARIRQITEICRVGGRPTDGGLRILWII